MEIEDAVDETENKPIQFTGLNNINPDAPDFIKQIAAKKSNMPLDMNVQYTPHNPYTLTIPGDHETFQDISGIKENKGNTAKIIATEAYRLSNLPRLLNWKLDNAYEQIVRETDLPKDPNYNPKTDASKFSEVLPQNMDYVLGATGPNDLDYRVRQVLSEQANDEMLENGETWKKVLGGLIGIGADPINWIPMVAASKYAKFGPQVWNSIKSSLPGVATSGFIMSGAKQLDTAQGNLKDFFTDGFINTALGTALFSVLGTGGLLIEKMHLWEHKDLLKMWSKGAEFKLDANEKGVLTGIKASDPTGSLSAAEVNIAQDLADSMFSKTGLFKIPYVGTGVTKFMGNRFLGSPALRLMNSSFETVSGFVDRAVENSFITKRIQEGKGAPVRFETLMKQTYAGLRALDGQMMALRLEMNGVDIKNRAAAGVVDAAIKIKNKTNEVLAKQMDNTDYVTKESFYGKIEEVLFSEVPSKHGPINEAAGMLRKHIDSTYAAYRKAHNLPENWMPPRTAEGYLMRVYDTPYLNLNEKKWIQVVGDWLEQADVKIAERERPILDINQQIENHKLSHNELITRPNVTDQEVKLSTETGAVLRGQKNALEKQLQNDLRNDPELSLHVQDPNALSADEVEEINQLTKRRDISQKDVNERKITVAKIKSDLQKNETGKLKAKTAKTGKKGQTKEVLGKEVLKEEEAKLAMVQRELEEEIEKLQEKMHNGEINPRLFTKNKDSFQYEFKDINNKLKLRARYGTESNPISAASHAKSYYDTIMNQTADDTISQIMGKFTGNGSENHLKHRTLLLPDKLLYDNNFMTKDLMSKVSNYTTYLSRRTNLKTAFSDVSIDGGIEPVLAQLSKEHDKYRIPLNERKSELQTKLENPDISTKEKKSLEKQIKKLDKEIVNKKKDFETSKKDLNHLYEKMMGISKVDAKAMNIKAGLMAMTSWMSLPFLPLTMINDIGAIGLQAGLMPLLKDGIYPMIESLNGLRKTMDSQSFRESAAAIDLAIQDIRNAYMQKNYDSLTNPYLNKGKISQTLEDIAHFSANLNLTNYFDNGLQRISSSVYQSEFMNILHKWKAGTISKNEMIKMGKYGVNLDEWGDRMLEAFKNNGGGKTKLGGYQSLFYRWEDMEASNKFGDAVFRAVKDTNIQSGIADSPFWMDEHSPFGVLGTIIKGFSGWTFASLNRYVVPTLQNPADLEKFVGLIFMTATGALVSPMRRLARGETAYPEDMTDKQWGFEVLADSGWFSYFSTILQDANLLSQGKLLEDLKNDKYKDRSMASLLGPTWGKIESGKNIINAAASGEWNESDMKQAARMVPIANSWWCWWMTSKLIEGIGLPKTRREAHALKGA